MERGIAITSLVLAAMLLIVMSIFAWHVVDSLTKPTPMFQSLSDRIAKERLESKDGLQITARAAIVMEYANADIRISGVQVAFGFIIGMFFVVVGLLLFSAGFSGALDMEAKTAGLNFKLATAAPGLAAVVIGGAITIAAVTKDISRPISAQIEEATGMSIDQRNEAAPRSGVGEGLPAGATPVPEENRSET